ncbi:MAG TPA: FtsX-like permease family protein [Candidatus Acidoferrales bacterium]|nr:FtsX-like permease family protein [Candidatus Acidoferrales bacterium]
MKTRDLTELAGRNLREALLRNSLTTLGIAVGVASLVAMLSLGVGLQDLASKRLLRTGLFDAVFVSPRVNIRGFGRAARDNPPSNEEPKPLDEDARQQIAGLAGVVEVYPEIRFFTEIRFAGSPYPTVVAGMPASARNNGAFDGMKGSFFSAPSADEAILQIEYAKELSDKTDTLIGKELILRYAERQALPADSAAGDSAPGKSSADSSSAGFSIIPREKKLKIVGIVETEPAAGFGGFGRGRVFIPLEVAQALRIAQANDLRSVLRQNSAKPGYASLTVRVASPSKVKEVEDAIKKMGFTGFSLQDVTRSLRLVFVVFDLFLGIFGSLALAVASLGIINTLVMAILERRREIGVLKALGASDPDVRKLFFAEAGAMGFLGGIFGVLLGWLIGRALTLGTNFYLARRELPPIDLSVVPWWMVFGAIAFAVVVSLAAGLYPASRAARLNPVEALRYE